LSIKISEGITFVDKSGNSDGNAISLGLVKLYDNMLKASEQTVMSHTQTNSKIIDDLCESSALSTDDIIKAFAYNTPLSI
jgi:hypothetical protein